MKDVLAALKIVQVDGQVFSFCSHVHAGVRSSIKQLDIEKGFKMITASTLWGQNMLVLVPLKKWKIQIAWCYSSHDAAGQTFFSWSTLTPFKHHALWTFCKQLQCVPPVNIAVCSDSCIHCSNFTAPLSKMSRAKPWLLPALSVVKRLKFYATEMTKPVKPLPRMHCFPWAFLEVTTEGCV